ncbi:MAG TPA: helix-turn-helix transcriptional regulator [Paludibacter sp.]
MNLRVKEICKAKGITIGDLAERMQMARESLSRAINGNPTFDTLEKIAQALDVPVSSLFDVESELYGVLIFKGKTYKIDSDQALQTFLNNYKAGS